MSDVIIILGCGENKDGGSVQNNGSRKMVLIIIYNTHSKYKKHFNISNRHYDWWWKYFFGTTYSYITLNASTTR